MPRVGGIRKGTKHYQEKARYEAVNLYKQVGSLQMVSNMLDIPYETIRKWHASDWWKDFELDIVQSNRARSNHKIKRIADQALVVIEDRLQNGDFIYDQRNSEVVRLPIKADIANRILHDSLNREALNDQANEQSKKLLSDEKMSDRLLRIQESFRALKSGRKLAIEGKVIDVEPQEEIPSAIHD